MASPCAMPAVSTTNSTEWTGWQNKSELHCDFTRRKERVSQNEEIKEAAISTFTIPGRSRCARTEFKRERESQRAKKGAADPRKKSKLKVRSCYFFLISYFHFLFGFSLGIFLEFAFSGLLQSEVSVACRWSFRLFDRQSPLALPTLITQSATVSNFLPQAHKKGKEKYIVFDPPKIIFSFLKPDITHDFVEPIQTT